MTRGLRFFAMTMVMVLATMSCSTEVDLYDKYEDIAIVYGLLDYTLDTNYIRVERAYMGYGNALEIAQIADSCNYPGKLQAQLIEVPGNKVIELDTITLHNKENGIFYGGDQRVYYTAEQLKPNCTYKLKIVKPDETIVSSETEVVGGSSFSVSTTTFNFSSTAKSAKVQWAPATNAALYEILLSFQWEEEGQTRIMKWSLGTNRAEDITSDHGLMSKPFAPEMFFNNLRSYLGDDTLKNVERKAKRENMKVSISAAGKDLATYIESNAPSGSIVQSTLDWTNLANAYGVFSSRVNIEKNVPITTQTMMELVQKGWGFVILE